MIYSFYKCHFYVFFWKASTIKVIKKNKSYISLMQLKNLSFFSLGTWWLILKTMSSTIAASHEIQLEILEYCDIYQAPPTIHPHSKP